MSDDNAAAMLRFAQGRLGRAATRALVRYFHATLHHDERIPRTGGALLVSNHAYFGIDSFVLTALVVRATGRYIHFVGERNLWRYAPFDSFFRTVAALPGDHDAVVAALRAGKLVGVYPGGIVDSLKHEKNSLPWGKRAGFARAAMRAAVPLIPISGVGIDDMYRVVAKERWVGRRLFGSDRYDLPIALGVLGTPIPRRARQRFVVETPIDTRGDVADAEAVERVRAAAYGAVSRRLKEPPDEPSPHRCPHRCPHR